MNKPHFISHYLVLRDLIKGVDVRQFSDSVYYLCARIENVKNDLVKQGLQFDDEAIAQSKYSFYKPYVLIQNKSNMERAKALLKKYGSNKVLRFLNEMGDIN